LTQVDRYFAAGAPVDTERELLRLLAAAYNDASQKRLKPLGIGCGWRCLEVGAGGGFMTKWLAETVAPNGSVVALDRNVQFVRELSLAGVEAREGDIVEDEIEKGAFDLVYSRFVVSHLADPVRALRKMAAALKPGGWLMVEDSDYASYRAADGTHPLSAVFDATVQRGLAYFHAKGAIQPTFGRAMPACVAALDVESIGSEVVELRHNGGSPESRALKQTFALSSDELVAAGAISQRDKEERLRALDDPTFEHIEVIYVAWGQKPASG
jgi:SAM-dependent methyltransferase